MGLSPVGLRGLAACMSTEGWQALAGMGRFHGIKAGQILVRQGDPGRDVVAILSGRAKVTRVDPDGNQSILALRGPGDVIGDLAALDAEPRSATVTAIQPMAIRRIRPEDFQRFLAQPEAALAYARYTVIRLRESDDRRADIAGLPARRRLARLLLELTADDRRSPAGISLRQQDLAELVGTSRNTVTTELGRLRAESVIETRWRHITVTDPPALAEIAARGVRTKGR
jgi:CRP/FNR family cyclic AMP-dependent transcriptional regulator